MEFIKLLCIGQVFRHCEKLKENLSKMPLIHPNRGGKRKFNEKRKKNWKNDTEDDLSEYENKKKLQNIDDSEKMSETSIEIPKSQLPNGVDWSVKIMPMSHQSK